MIFYLQEAIASVSDERTLQWLKLGIVKETDYDIKIIDDIMKTTSRQTDSIEEYIKELEEFQEISNVILERYKQEKESFT